MRTREVMEQHEEDFLSPLAAKSRTATRGVPVEEDPFRTAFQRDRDRIIHSKAFRRLKHKTQVYIAPSDHYRTRMTHTLEVGQIGRTIARALGLNEDLTEAIAMGHDVGHTPFGHVGELTLSKLVGRYEHNEQSLRVVDVLERNGQGLNLTEEVKDGILCHTGNQLPKTLEGQIIRISDRVAYLCHDFDDALRADILQLDSIPTEVRRTLGESPSEMITNMVTDLIQSSDGQELIQMSSERLEVMNAFRVFMFKHVYLAPGLMVEREKASHVVSHLFHYYLKHPKALQEEAHIDRIITIQDIVDYVGGLTDQYAIKLFQEKYIPATWG